MFPRSWSQRSHDRSQLRHALGRGQISDESLNLTSESGVDAEDFDIEEHEHGGEAEDISKMCVDQGDWGVRVVTDILVTRSR